MSARPSIRHFSRLSTARARATVTTPCLFQAQSYQPFRCVNQRFQQRYLHKRIAASPIPEPTPFIPNHQAFLTVIGRGLSQHASKIPSWKALFTLTSSELRELGVEPARSRRYLLHWLERFRNGRFGVGGDCGDVNEDGSAELRIVETPVVSADGSTNVRSALRRATATRSAGMRRMVVNLSGKTVGIAKEESGEGDVSEAEKGKGDSNNDDVSEMRGKFGLQMHLQLPAEEAERRRVAFVSLKNASIIKGPHVEPIKASVGGAVGVARIVRKEGLWEDRRGHKVDGGERRKAQVRAKKRRAERKAAGLQ